MIVSIQSSISYVMHTLGRESHCNGSAVRQERRTSVEHPDTFEVDVDGTTRIVRTAHLRVFSTVPSLVLWICGYTSKRGWPFYLTIGELATFRRLSIAFVVL